MNVESGMAGRLVNKRIIVTGGASGIGLSIALRIRHEGGCVGLIDRDSGSLGKAIEQLGGESKTVTGRVGDLLDTSVPASAIEALTDHLGGLDGIVCVAGVFHSSPVLDYDIADWNRIIGINLTGAFLCAQAAGRLMRAAGTGGSIVMISSSLAVLGSRERAAYVASKAGILGVAKTLALELGDLNIRCNSIAPGLVETPLATSNIERSYLDAWGSRTALGRIGKPEDIAPTACFLLSDESGWITGQTIHVDGGFVFR
jgi:3-oxoacyl-[acyl-carrier protein] reductase